MLSFESQDGRLPSSGDKSEGEVSRSFAIITSQEAKRGVNYVTTVIRKPNESLDNLLKRFRKSVNTSGTLGALRRKRWHVSRGELSRLKKRKGIQRARRKQHRKETRASR